MCNCIKETTEKLQSQLKESVEKDKTVNEWIDKGNYQNKSLSFNGKPTRIVMPFVIQYRRQKVNGEPERKITTEHVNIFPSFCPFCGVEYEK